MKKTFSSTVGEVNSLLFISNKTKLGFLILFLVFVLSACTGAGPTASPLSAGPENAATGSDNKPGSSRTPDDTASNTDNSESPSNTDSGAVAMINPPAQPTQPLTPQLGLFVDGIVLLPGTDPNTKCEKGFDSVPTVKSWEREPGGNWKLKHILDKYESDADANNPYIVNPCGAFRARLYLLLGPPDKPCLWNNEAKLTASYRDSNGTLYTGESHLYTCQDAYNLPNAMIILENKMTNQMVMPK